MKDQPLNEPPTPRTFKLGDQVQWMAAYPRGEAIRFSTRYGRIIAFSAEAGASAQVKMAGGRTRWVVLAELRHDGEKSALTEEFEKLADRGGAS